MQRATVENWSGCANVGRSDFNRRSFSEDKETFCDDKRPTHQEDAGIKHVPLMTEPQNTGVPKNVHTQCLDSVTFWK